MADRQSAVQGGEDGEALDVRKKGVQYMRAEYDGFTSTNAPSRYEEEISLQFRGTNWTYTQRFVALLRAGDGGSMLRPEYFDRALQVNVIE
uniref:Uncharacterized protein n=1 Tax=Parascaris equorum TaxID=6256 RepID=A0A914R7R7_PAREQ